MPFQIQCDNKKCYQVQEAKLDTETNVVICNECGQAINGVTEFTKRQLKSFGQTTKNASSKQSFAVSCAGCKFSGTPILEDNKLVCFRCKRECSNLSSIFEKIVKEKIGNG